MPTYAFRPVEQDVIRELGKLGFRYAHETKKVIEFVSDADGRTVYLNREHSGIALVVSFGSEAALRGIAGVIKTGPRASSNFTDLDLGLTRNDLANHQGLQVVITACDYIKPVLGALS